MLSQKCFPKEDTREVRTYSRGRTVTRASRDETCMLRVATRVATLWCAILFELRLSKCVAVDAHAVERA